MTPYWVVIPARRASTRLPNKALADIGGKPMVVRVAERAQRSGATRIIVATDCDEIQAVCQQAGIQAVMTASDHPSGTDRIAEVATQLKAASTQLIVNVQGDEPLINPELIHDVGQALAQAPEHHVATAATPIHDARELTNPNVVKVVCEPPHEARYFSRAPIPWCRDQWPSLSDITRSELHGAIPALRHIGLYAYRVGALRQFVAASPSALERIEQLEQLRWFALHHTVQVVITAQAPHAGVDTQEDLLRVRALWDNEK